MTRGEREATIKRDGQMTAYQVLAIVVFLLVLGGAGVALYAAFKRRLQLMLIALGFMQIPIGIENLRIGPRWIAYVELAVGAAALVVALTQRSRLQRNQELTTSRSPIAKEPQDRQD